MMNNSTCLGRGIASVTSCLATLMLLLTFLPTDLHASPYVFSGGEPATATVDWSQPTAAFATLVTEAAEREMDRLRTNTSAAVVAQCFNGFDAGDDTSYCFGEDAPLNGGYDSYTDQDPATTNDQQTIQWTILNNSGQGSFLVNGVNFGGTATNSTALNGTGNFNTTTNGAGNPSVVYRPAPGDQLVVLQLTVESTDGACDVQVDEVRIFFKPEQQAAFNLTGNGVMSTDNTTQVCSGEIVDVEIDNPQGIFPDDPEPATLHYSYTVTDPSGQITGLPASGVGEAGQFDATFNNLTLNNPSGTSATATVEVTVFYDRDNDDIIDTDECEGAATSFSITVFPQAQATVSVNNGTNNTFCEDDTAEFRVTGSPNSTVTYQIDPGTGNFGADQTIMLGASGTNGGINGEAVNLIMLPLTGLGGTGDPVRINLSNVQYTAAPACPRSLSFTRSITVVDTPEGVLSLTNASDAAVCNGTFTGSAANLSLTFSTPSGAGDYDLTIVQTGTGSATTINRTVTTTGAGATTTGTVAVPFPASSPVGQTINFQLTGIVEAGSGLGCGGNLSPAGTPITVIEQPDPVISFTASAPGNGPVTVFPSAVTPNLTICDNTTVSFSGAAFPASLVVGNTERIAFTVSANGTDFFGANRTLTVAEVDALDATIDIPNNAGTQMISLQFTPFYDANGNDVLDAGECTSDPSNLSITVLEAITAFVTTSPAATSQPTPANDLVSICSGEDVVFTINTNVTSGSANVVVDNGPNQVVTINGLGEGTFTLTGVTDPATFTLVDVTANGCTVEFNESIDVEVEAVPEGDVSVSDDDICLEGESTITYTATGGETGQYNYSVEGFDPNTNQVYQLVLTGGATISVNPNQFNFDTPGTYEFYLTRVENAGGLNCGTDYTIGVDAPVATVTVEEAPQAAISSNVFTGNAGSTIMVDNDPATMTPADDSDNEVCSGSTVTLTGMPQSNVTSAATGDQLYYYLAVVTDETGTYMNGDDFVIPATTSMTGDVLLTNTFTNPSATNEANVVFSAFAFYGDGASTPMPDAVVNNTGDFCFGGELTFAFEVLPTPEADFGSNQTVCFNSAAVIDFTGTPGAEVTVEVLAGMTNAVAGNNPNGGAALQMTGDTDIITLSNSGSAFFTTGDMTTDLQLRITRVESTDGCINTDPLDVEVIVLPQNDASFPGPATLDACEGTTVDIPVSGTPNAVVVYGANVGSSPATVTLDGNGNGTLTTPALVTGVNSFFITSITLTTVNQSGNNVVCTNPPTGTDISVQVTAEEAPSGTIAAVEPVCSGTEQPLLTFTQTAGNTATGLETFDLVINGQTYNDIEDGETFTVPATLTANTTFELTSITETTAGSMGCSDAVAGTISSTTVTVEAIPAVTVDVDLDGEMTTVSADVNSAVEFRDTVCSGTVLDVALTGTPPASSTGAVLAYRILINDPANLLGFGAGMNDVSLTTAQFDAFIAPAFPATLNNNGGANVPPAQLDITIIPFYQTNPGDNQTAANSCPGDTVAFSGLVLGELTADFDSAPQTICEDGTATIDFVGTPNIEISLFDGSNIITVETDNNGEASYTTGVLTTSTTYTITGFSTLPAAMLQCTRTVFNGSSQTVTVTPTPTLVVDMGASDLEICNDGSSAVIGLTSNSANARVTYNLNGGFDQTFDLTGTTGSLSIPGLTADATVTFTMVTTDPNVAPVCPATVSVPVDIVVRDLPDPELTNDGPVCAGGVVNLSFTDNGADATGPYIVVVRAPAGATAANFTGSPTASNTFANSFVFTGVSAGAFTAVDFPGLYEIVAIRDQGINPNVGCADNEAAAGGLTSTTVVIDDEPVLNALVASQAGVVGLSQGGINAFNTTVCNGEVIDVDFQSTNPVSNSGNPLFLEFTNVSDPAGILAGYLPAENGTLTLAAADFNQALNNPGATNAVVSFTVTPFYEDGNAAGREAAECAGRTLSFNVTVLPQLMAEITSPADNTTEVCDGETVTFQVTGTEGAEVTFITTGLSSVSLSPATIPAGGVLTITGTADFANSTGNVIGFATLDLTEVELVTNVNGTNKTCSVALNDNVDVAINQLPTGFLDLDDNGPLCAGEDVTVIFRTSFAPGDYVVTVNGVDYPVTVSAPGVNPVFVGNLFTDQPGVTTTYDLTKITFVNTGCMTTGTPIDSETIIVNDVPAGSVTAAGNSTLTIADDPAPTATVCTGESLTLNASFDGTVTTPAGNANYVSVDYTADGDYFGIGTSGTIALPVGDFASQFSTTFQNLTDTTQNASLAVTYYFEENPGTGAMLNAGECTGDTDLLDIAILPNPIATDVDLTICSGDEVDFDLDAAITNGVTDVSYTYTVMPTTTAFGASGSVVAGDNLTMAAGMLENLTTANQEIIFTVTPATGPAPGCAGNDFTFTLTVQPEPVLEVGPQNTPLCSQAPIGIVLGSNVSAITAVSYNVVSITPSTVMNFTAAAGNATTGITTDVNVIADDEFTNFTSVDQTVTYAIAPISGAGCIGDTVDVVATITPEPFVTDLRDTVCSGVRLDVDIINDLVINAVGRPASIRVRRSRLAGVTNFFVIDENDNQVPFDGNGDEDTPPNTNNGLEIIQDSLINLTNGGIDLVYDIEVNNTQGCGRNTFTYTLRVVPEATATLDVVGSASFCSDESVTLNAGIQGGSAPGNIQYSYSVLSADPGVLVRLTPSGSSVNVAARTGTTAGNATIMVMIDDDATGCTATATQVVTVGVTPEANPIQGPQMPCVNEFTNYTVRDRGNDYEFTLSNPAAGEVFMTGIDTSFTIQFNSNAGQGPFVLTMTETSPDGCVNTEDIIISLVSQASADFFFQLNADNVNRRVAFTNNSAGNPTNFSWEFGANGEFGTSNQEDPVVDFPDNPVTPGAPYDVDVTLTVTGACAPNVTTVTKTITINAISVCDDLDLVAGINFVTFNVEPIDSAATTVFNGVPGLVQVVGYEDGLPQVFVPGNGSANTLDTIRKGAGYVIIVNQPSTLQVCGTPIDPTFKRPLDAGVNYVGYMGMTPTSSDSYFADLIANPTVNFLVAQTFGNDLPTFAEVYVPGNGSANFQTMRPGRGYLILVDGAVPVYRAQVEPTEAFEFYYGSVSGDGFVPGSSVDVVNGRGEVVGELTTDAQGNFRATPLFGEVARADGSFADGLSEGETLRFRYRGEILNDEIVYNGRMNVTNLNLVVTQPTNEVVTPTAFSLSVTPNPVGSQATISVSNDVAGEIEVLLMDVNGRVAARVYQGTADVAETIRFEWNETAGLTPGIYNLIVLRDGHLLPEATTRLVKQ